MVTAYKELFAKALVTRPGTADKFGYFIVRHPGTADFKALLTVRQSGTANLSATTYILSTITGTPAELSATFHVGQQQLNLKVLMVVQHPATKDMLGYFQLINDTGVISQGIDASVLQALGIIS